MICEAVSCQAEARLHLAGTPHAHAHSKRQPAAAEKLSLLKAEGVHIVPSIELQHGLREAGPPESQRRRLGIRSFPGSDSSFGGQSRGQVSCQPRLCSTA